MRWRRHPRYGDPTGGMGGEAHIVCGYLFGGCGCALLSTVLLALSGIGCLSV